MTRFCFAVGALALPLILAAAPAGARESATALLEKAIACTAAVKPETVLRALQREKLIGATPANNLDGIPTFVVIKPLRIEGLAVKFVEGWDYEGKLFSRGPGTSPGVFVAITVAGDRKTVDERFPEVRIDGDDGHAEFLRYTNAHIQAYDGKPHAGLVSVTCRFPEPSS
jgi:hypothetical protein